MGREAWVRIIPFAVFMVFIGLQQGFQWLIDNGRTGLTEAQLLYLYPFKAVAVAVLLLYFWREYSEIHRDDFKNVVHTLGSLCLGILVFVLWINMDWDFATLGQSRGFDPFLNTNQTTRSILIGFRLLGAALVVPVMEELFWRSFLMRYIVNANFSSVRIGTYTLSSFLIGSVLFGLEHNLVLAGIMAGIAYSLLLYWTKSIYQCILAHAVTNLALGIYVLQTGYWQFW
ncbi:MAG: CAAX prenyl protease-related protein [Desulfuromonadales bacterium]|nr:CAAX prenyl protease-related protein [Desulfuromonadales bacterium]MBN2793208.1 CAAX prenyl protease-related protein [Desulfuromonadales bacterium]